MNLDTIFLLIQTIFIALAAGLTWYLYDKAKKDDLRSRATMLYYQIKDVQKNIEHIKDNCYKNNTVLSGEFYKSNLIYTRNLWEENKIHLAKKLSLDSYNELERFYMIATALLNEQIAVKNYFSSLVASKQNVYYDRQINSNIDTVFNGRDNGTEANDVMKAVEDNKKLLDIAINFLVDDFVPGISNDIIKNNLSNFFPLTDGVAYQKIKKIAKINN